MLKTRTAWTSPSLPLRICSSGVLRVRGAARLHADLDDALVLAGGLDHLAAFPDVVGERLLHVDVLARLAGQDGPEGVPVVGRRVDQGVHVLVVEDTPEVLHDLRRFALGLLDGLLRPCRAAVVRVADIDDLRIAAAGEHLGHGRAPAPAAHQADHHLLIGGPALPLRQHGHHRGGPQRTLQELPAIHRSHCSSPRYQN